jgi:hypothetical protein
VSILGIITVLTFGISSCIVGGLVCYAVYTQHFWR